MDPTLLIPHCLCRSQPITECVLPVLLHPVHPAPCQPRIPVLCTAGNCLRNLQAEGMCWCHPLLQVSGHQDLTVPQHLFSLDFAVSGRQRELGGTGSEVAQLHNLSSSGKSPDLPFGAQHSLTALQPREQLPGWKGSEERRQPALSPGHRDLTPELLEELTERKIKNSNMGARQIWRLHHIIPFLKILIHFCWPIPRLRNVLNPRKLCFVSIF